MFKLPEPVAWMSESGFATEKKEVADGWRHYGGKVRPLFTADQLREAVREALEEAALKCERRADSVTWGSAIARQCARDIRSLQEAKDPK